MTHDIWHYPRLELARSVFTLFDSGLSSALTFFAPRRMGKTEFLLKDIRPLALKQGWQVFYFSFLDSGDDPEGQFVAALSEHALGRDWFHRIRRTLPRSVKIGGNAAGVGGNLEIAGQEAQVRLPDAKELIARLAGEGNSTLLLLDEVQVLANRSGHDRLVASLRTGLDLHKDRVKVIFTGSSREGLRRMFSRANAPFFHFGQNLDFPSLERGFTDHLADCYHTITTRALDKDALWQAFEDLQRVPASIRALVERLVLNPLLTLEQALDTLQEDIAEQRDYAVVWAALGPLDREILLLVARGESTLFAARVRRYLADTLGLEKLTSAEVHTAVRRLVHRELLSKQSARGSYVINDPAFGIWLVQR